MQRRGKSCSNTCSECGLLLRTWASERCAGKEVICTCTSWLVQPCPQPQWRGCADKECLCFCSARVGSPVKCLLALQMPARASSALVVGPLADEGLVVVKVPAGRPQTQVRVVALACPGQLPVRAREQRVGPRSAPQVQHDGSIRPRASPGALRDLLSLSRPTCHSFFTGPVFFARPRAVSGHLRRWSGARFAWCCAEKMLLLQPVYLYTGRSNSSFCTIFCMA